MKTMLKIITVCVCALGLIACGGSSTSNTSYEHGKKTYDSAMEKLNRGEELTSAERQIVDDVLNWCNTCDNTMRMCKCN